MTLRELKASGVMNPQWDPEVAASVLASRVETDSSLPRIGRVSLGIGAWLAGFFLIGFVAAALDLRDEEPMAGIGAILVLVSVLLLWRKLSNPFLEQLALALGLAGHLMAFVGCHDLFSNDLAGPFLAAVILAAPVYWFSRHSVQRFFSGFWIWLTWWGTSIGNWSAKLNEPLFLLMLVTSLGVVLAVLGGMPKLNGPTWRPALWSAVVGLGGGLFWLTNSFDPDFGSVPVERIFGAAASLGFLAVLWHLLRPEGRGLVGFVMACVLLVGLALAGAPGVVVSLGLMLLAHARSDRFLEAVAVVMLALFLIAVYYHLGLPLNQKSITLMAAGAGLLGLRWWFGQGGATASTSEISEPS